MMRWSMILGSWSMMNWGWSMIWDLMSFVSDISDISIISIDMILDVLRATIGKKNRVVTFPVTVFILSLSSVKCGSMVIVMYSVLISEWMRLFFVVHWGVVWFRGMV